MSGHLVDSVGWTLLHFLWQGTLVGLATALLLRILRGAPAQQRYLVACAGLLACLCWPALELAGRLLGGGAAYPMAFAQYPAPGPLSAASGAFFAMLGTHLAQLVMAWAVCALALALRMAAGIHWIRRCAARHPSVPEWERRAAALARGMGIRRAVRVRAADGLDTPVTAGWLRPLIVLPAALLSGMPPHLLNALLAHELAHVRRWDYPVNLVQNLIETILFYHPVVWWISRRARAERELIADTIAAQALGAPRLLAEALSALDRHQAAGQTALAASGGDLLARIRALVQPQARRTDRGATLLAIAVTLSAIAGLSAATGRPGADRAWVPATIDFSSCVKPEYPAAALAAGQTGSVVLAFDVRSDGAVAGVTVGETSGHPLLDTAAFDALARCRFRPALANGTPVAARQAVKYVWVLE